MVGIVLVSHSRPLASSVREIVRSMTGPALPIAIAAGAGDRHLELGTDALEIAEAIVSLKGPDGVLVLMDIGSAILSAEIALELLDPPIRSNVRLCAAPFVEGAVAAGVTANLGSTLEEVCTEALAALSQKQNALDSPAPSIPSWETAARPTKPPPLPAQKAAAANGAPTEKIRVKVRNLHGLHARPAARLINEARAFRSEITVRNATNQRGPVSARSLSSLAALEVLHGNEIELFAKGDDARAALEKLKTLVESGLGDALPPISDPAAAAAPPAKPAETPPRRVSDPLPVSPGIVIGTGTYFAPESVEISDAKIENTEAEIKRLRNAVDVAEQNLEARREKMTVAIGAENAGIYEAQILALQDPELIDTALRIIGEEKINAAMAWDRANRQILRRYEALHDAYLRERAADLKDVGRQVLDLLAGKRSVAPMPSEPGIVIADNLAPYQVAALNPKVVIGVILLDGGPTAHATILLKALGIPTIINARSAFAEVDLRWPVGIAFDGSTGKIWIDPDANFLTDLKTRQIEENKRNQEELRTCSEPVELTDGRAISVYANIGNATEVESALRSGAEGVGLLRTEFLFLNRASAPTEEEQIEELLAVSNKMEGKPLIVRTLDVGGDKDLPYLERAAEENPFLGVRAIRLSFSREDLFITQLRAVLRAGKDRDFRIMFPMIANVTDMERAMNCLDKVHHDLDQENVPHLWPVQTGIMIEIPSAALQAEAMAEHADFFSIGTNDLTQYTLAADRGNPDLASYQDALHPSVLRLIHMVVSGARRHERPVSICGEAASDERAATIFVGLGIRELSLTSAKIPHLKACLRKQSFNSLQRLAHTALHCQTAAEVRALKLAL
jgi:phosphoenolpyruvate-protein phosphotransferase/dihydroxyacetone kinase phosphotransfer subunit